MMLMTTLFLSVFLTLGPGMHILDPNATITSPREWPWASHTSNNQFKNPISKMIAWGASSFINAIVTAMKAGRMLSKVLLRSLMLGPFIKDCHKTKEDTATPWLICIENVDDEIKPEIEPPAITETTTKTDLSTTTASRPATEASTTTANMTTIDKSTTKATTTTTDPSTITETTTSTATIAPTADYDQCRKDAVADVILLMDSSKSVGSQNWMTLLNVVAKVTKNFELGPSGVQLAAVTYSDSPVKLFDLKTYSDYDFIEKSLKKAKFLNDQTMTYKAYDFIRLNSMFDAKYGGRPYAPDIVVNFIEGQSDSPTKTIAAGQKLRDKGVEIRVVAIGPQPYEIYDLVKTPDDVIVASSYDSLNQIETKIVKTICQGAVTI